MHLANCFGPSLLVLRHFWQLEQQTRKKPTATNKMGSLIMFGISGTTVTMRMRNNNKGTFRVKCDKPNKCLVSAMLHRKISSYNQSVETNEFLEKQIVRIRVEIPKTSNGKFV